MIEDLSALTKQFSHLSATSGGAQSQSQNQKNILTCLTPTPSVHSLIVYF